MTAKVHSPSGALEECAVTELEKGLCVRVCVGTESVRSATQSAYNFTESYAVRHGSNEVG